MSSLKHACLLLCLAISANAQTNPDLVHESEAFIACQNKAANTPGRIFRLERDQDKLHGDSQTIANTLKREDQMLQILKDTWPGQLGFDALYHRAMSKNTAASVGAYDLSVKLMDYFCESVRDPATNKNVPTKLHTPRLEGYSDTSAPAMELGIHVNSTRGLTTSEKKMSIDGEVHTVLQIKRLVAEVDGFQVFGSDLYEGPHYVYFGRPGVPIFLPITQKQYVEALIRLDEERFGTPGHPGTFQGSFSQEYEDKLREDMHRFLRETPPAVLNQPAFTRTALGQWTISRNSDGTQGEPFFQTDPKGTSALVRVNPAYLRKDAPSYLPQMMVLEWRGKSDDVSEILLKRFLTNFPARRLQSMLDK